MSEQALRDSIAHIARTCADTHVVTWEARRVHTVNWNGRRLYQVERHPSGLAYERVTCKHCHPLFKLLRS